jgi:type IV pilus assembly protein PilN
MIKINLLAAERKVAKKKFPIPGAGGGAAGGGGSKMAVLCSLILIAGALLVGWRYWELTRESTQLDVDIAAAQAETARLHTVIQQVQQFEQRRAQLQQRVALIEELRRNQTGPVHMLDQISRALPEMLWLIGLKQGTDPNEVFIDGRSTSLTGLSDYVANLEASGYFKRSVEIVSTTVESSTGPTGEIIRFQLRALFQQPGSASASMAHAPGAHAAPAAAPAPKQGN